MEAPPIVLRLNQISIHHKGVRAIAGLDLELSQGSCTAVVGANGSGKSTLLHTLVGLHPFEGGFWWKGQELRYTSPVQALQHGIALCPADRGIFSRLTVEENLRVGGHLIASSEELGHRVDQQLKRFPGLARRRMVPSGLLSGGERQQLAVARALMMQPALLLLDEPSRGLSPAAIAIMLSTLKSLAAEGMTIMLADQALDWLHGHVDRILILATGCIIADSMAENCSLEQMYSSYFAISSP